MADSKKIKNDHAPKFVKKKDKPKTDPKKVLIVVAVIALVVALSLFVDYQVKNPRVNEGNDASNRIFAAQVLSNNPEITADTSVQMEELEPMEIEGKTYWPVEITINYDTPEAKVLPLYYVAQSNGKVYTMDDSGKLVPYGV